METVELLAVISIAIMCWLFCTFFFFSSVFKEGDDKFAIITKLIVAIIIGWIMTPIALGIKFGNS